MKKIFSLLLLVPGYLAASENLPSPSSSPKTSPIAADKPSLFNEQVTATLLNTERVDDQLAGSGELVVTAALDKMSLSQTQEGKQKAVAAKKKKKKSSSQSNSPVSRTPTPKSASPITEDERDAAYLPMCGMPPKPEIQAQETVVTAAVTTPTMPADLEDELNNDGLDL